MATFPRTAITGTNTMEDPRSQHILMKLTAVPFISVPNGGSFNGGNPDLTFPLNIHINLNQLWYRYRCRAVRLFELIKCFNRLFLKNNY